MGTELKRGKVLIPRAWTQFPRAAQARAMCIYAFDVLATTAFTDLSRADAVQEALRYRKDDSWMPEQLQSLMMELARAEDAGRKVRMVRVEDPREHQTSYGGQPCSCPGCDEYGAPLPEWCAAPHSDGQSINPERRIGRNPVSDVVSEEFQAQQRKDLAALDEATRKAVGLK